VIDLSRPRVVVDGITLYLDAVDDGGARYEALRNELNVRQEYLRFFGRDVAMPRLTAWYGDAGASYTYSGLRNEPQPWPRALFDLRNELNTALSIDLNSCLANWYRNGDDSMGWHADNDRELQDSIVSVSFGTTRTFQVREGRKGLALSLELRHASVLVMTVASQNVYQHRIPKELGAKERLNLTFRKVASGVERSVRT
jgi:alkylated DNA repair dioxygenase AlkB